MNDEIQGQVEQQCKVVAHLATAIATVHRQKAEAVSLGAYSVGGMLDDLGRRTAFLMETLGDVLNEMDAVDPDEDAWVDPVFAEAHRLWPSPAERADSSTPGADVQGATSPASST